MGYFKYTKKDKNEKASSLPSFKIKSPILLQESYKWDHCFESNIHFMSIPKK